MRAKETCARSFVPFDLKMREATTRTWSFFKPRGSAEGTAGFASACAAAVATFERCAWEDAAAI